MTKTVHFLYATLYKPVCAVNEILITPCKSMLNSPSINIKDYMKIGS